MTAGHHWQEEEDSQILSTQALTAKILCQRHNLALSPLDTSAIAAYQLLHGFQVDLRTGGGRGNELGVLSGEELERWMLKLMWGSSMLQGPALLDGQPDDQVRFLDYLFRDGDRPAMDGLFMSFVPRDLPIQEEGFVLVRHLKEGDELRAVVWEFGNVALCFALSQPERVPPRPGATRALIVRRPGQINFTVQSITRKALGLAWDAAPGGAFAIRVDGS